MSWRTGGGWLLGGRDAAMRRTMLLVTSLRNISVGLVVATGAFAGTPAVTAVVAFGLVSLLGTVALATWLGRPPPCNDATNRTRS